MAGQEQKDFYFGYDLDANTLKYGRILPRRDMGQVAGVITSGSSTTVTSAVANSRAFASVAVGDMVEFVIAQVLTRRKVATKVSDDEITVNSAVDLSAGCSAWYHRPFQIGTADTDGWHNVEDYPVKAIKVDINTLSAAPGLTISIEVRGRGDVEKPSVVLTKNYTATDSDVIQVTEPCASVRVGVRGTTGFAGTDDIDISLIGYLRPSV
jgi:hypothetical protein